MAVNHQRHREEDNTPEMVEQQDERILGSDIVGHQPSPVTVGERAPASLD